MIFFKQNPEAHERYCRISTPKVGDFYEKRGTERKFAYILLMYPHNVDVHKEKNSKKRHTWLFLILRKTFDLTTLITEISLHENKDLVIVPDCQHHLCSFTFS